MKLGAATERQLTALYAAHRAVPQRDILRAATTQAARVTASGAQWALVQFQAVAGAPAAVQAVMQDGGEWGLFERQAGLAWRFKGFGAIPTTCTVGIPNVIRQLWRLGTCPPPGTSSPQPLRRPGILAMAAGTVDDLVDTATNQVGVDDNPAASSITQSNNCNPFTGLENTSASSASCGFDSRFDVQDRTEYWCADFAKWVWQQVNVDNTGQLDSGATSFDKWGYNSGQKITLEGGATGVSATPAVGDAMVLYPPGTTQGQVNTSNPVGADHVAIVTGVNSDGTITTVNGDFIWYPNSTVQVSQVDNSNNSNNTPQNFANQAEHSGEEFVFISPQLGSGSSRPPAPTTPVVDFPGWSAEHLFAQGTDGSVQEIDRTSSGWGSWTSLGNNITGTPAGFAEQSGQLDVFANRAGGVLQGRREASGGWELWVSLASGLPTTFTNSPYPVYDTGLSRNEIYDTTTSSSNNVYLLYGGAGAMTSWTSWINLTGLDVQGSVAPVYDPINQQMLVFATSSSGTLYYDARPSAPGSNWSGWFPVAHSSGLPTDFNRSPVAVYDPVQQRMEVYETEPSGAIWLIDGTGSNPGNWTNAPYKFDTTSMSAIGKPTVLVDTNNGNNQMDLFATNSTGYLKEDTNSGSGWSGWTTVDSGTTQKLNGTPYAIYDPVSGSSRNEVFFTEAGSQLGYYYGTDPNANKWTGLKVFTTQQATL